MRHLSDYDIRQSEKYVELNKEMDGLFPGLAAYITIAGALLFVSGAVFGGGGGESDPMFIAGVGAAVFVGGGGYWIHLRDTEKRLSQEMRSIERYFTEKKMRIYSTGRVYPEGE